MQPFLQNIQQFLNRLTLGQKVALGGVLLGGLTLLIAISMWAGQPNYALLFGNLEPTDASQIVESLEEQGIKYQLKESGTAVYVPREEVYELRLSFAGQGMISNGPAGYELFDQNTLGMTDFMQKLNMKRALEGELAKTITNIRQVEVSRVHLVMPERSPFRETQTRPSASVVLELVGGGQLLPGQIEGITALVSGAVEGLDVSDVTVLDTRGNMLSNPDAGNPEITRGSTQLRMQQAVEQQLTEKSQTMLDRVLGPGNSIVRVAAALDFTQSVQERDLIDPESQSVVAEEKQEYSDEGLGTDNASVKNYEFSRTRERSEKSLGEISTLTVSVILNHKLIPPTEAELEENEEAEATFETYSLDELTNIESIVKNAVGFQEDRGDRIALHQTQFDTSADMALSHEILEQKKQESLQQYIRYGLMAVALLLAALLIRSATKRVTMIGQEEGLPLVGEGSNGQLQLDGREGVVGELGGVDGAPKQLTAGDEEEEDLGIYDDYYSSKLSAEAKARLKAKHLMFEEIKKSVLERPDDAADILRSWIVEDLQAAKELD